MSKPVVSMNIGGLSVALWDNDNGQSVTVQKSYRKGEDMERKSLTIFPDEVSPLLALLTRMEEKVIRVREEE